MKQYIAKLMFNINIDNGNHTSQFDEQIRIIESSNLENAFHKARILGKKEEEIFLNNDEKQVNWKFIDVLDLYPLEELKDGDQIYSTTHENEDSKSFINYIKSKSMLIQAKTLTFV